MIGKNNIIAWKREKLMSRNKRIQLFLYALKLAVGSCLAIYIAELLQLEFSSSAGIIAMLTIATTKWETVKLSFYRMISFLIAVTLLGVISMGIGSQWLAFGIYVFFLVVICRTLSLSATISINAVIGTHFLTTRDFHLAFIFNEFLLMLIGVSIALVLNLFQGNKKLKQEIARNMQYTEQQLRMIMSELAACLTEPQWQGRVWEDMKQLQRQMEGYIADSREYRDNTFQSYPRYYISYFEMRSRQCGILENLHDEIGKIRMVPRQAKIIADYMLYLTAYVEELNYPTGQLDRLHDIFQTMKKEPLPAQREEFESRAILYHILMDLEEFLLYKKRFVEEMELEKRTQGS